MSILLLSTGLADAVPLPPARRSQPQFVHLPLGGEKAAGAAWNRRVARAFAGITLVVMADDAPRRFDRTTAARLAVTPARKIALVADGSARDERIVLAASWVDLVVADGVSGRTGSIPIIDAVLSDPMLVASLLRSLSQEEERPWRVYLLRCGDGSYYTGVSNDPVGRLVAHQEGKGARYTRGRGPFRLLALSPPLEKGAALSFEARIKKRLPREEKPLAVRTGP